MGRITFKELYEIYVLGGRSATKLISVTDERFIPTEGGVYIVHPPKGFNVSFQKNPDGTRVVDGKELPNEYSEVVAKYNRLNEAGADLNVLYYGQASNLRRRLKEYAKFGYAHKNSKGRIFEEHAGGKLLWYIKNNKDLEVEFYTVKDYDGEEKRLIREYHETYHEFPLANERF